MNYSMPFVYLVLSLVTFEVMVVLAFPQSLSDVAIAVKQTDLNYYHSEAPDLIPFDNPQSIDNAKEEHEGHGSKILSVYDGLQHKSSNIFKPKPVVDNIKSEKEIYGNTGDQLKHLDNIIVSTMSVVSNLVNSLVDAPGNAFQFVTKRLNTGLNQLGGKLVGL